jgi:hypothetical protein
MADTEIERLVVKLTGDNGDFQAMLMASVNAMGEMAKTVTSTIEEMHAKMGAGIADEAAKGALAASGISFLGSKFKEFGQSALHNYGEAERGEMMLSTALKANGRDVDATLDRYKDYANELQKTTTLEDDYVLTLFKKAEQQELSGKYAEQAVHDAVSLAAATGGSADAMMRMSSAMAKGDIKGAMQFKRMIPELRSVKDETELVAKYNKLVATGFAQAQAETNTYMGAMKRLNVAYGNAQELIGKVVADGLVPLVKWLQEGVDWFQTLSPETIKWITIIGGVVAGVAALGIGWAVFGSYATAALGALMALFSPIGLLVAGLAGTVYLVIQSLGGFTAAWGMVKQAAMDFWDYVQPTLMLFWGLAVEVFTTLKDTAVQSITMIGEWFRETFGGMMSNAKSTFDQIRDWVQEAAILIGFSFNNAGTIITLMFLKAELSVVSFAMGLKHFFTVAIPGYVVWFADNFQSIFFTAVDYGLTTLINFGQSVRNLFTAIWDFISSGGTATIDWDGMWVPLTKGAANAVKNMPNIPDRVKTDMENSLKQTIDPMEQKLTDDFTTYRANKLKSVGGSAEIKKLDELKKPLNDAKGGFQAVEKAAKSMVQATEFGGAESFSRIEKYLEGMASTVAEGAAGAAGGAKAIAGNATATSPGMQMLAVTNAEAGNGGERPELNTISTGIQKLVQLTEQGNKKLDSSTSLQFAGLGGGF